MIMKLINRKKLVKKIPVTISQIEELLYSLDDSTMISFSYRASTGMSSIEMKDYPYVVIPQVQNRTNSDYKKYQANLEIYHIRSGDESIKIEHHIGISIQDAISDKKGKLRKDLSEEAALNYVVNF